MAKLKRQKDIQKGVGVCAILSLQLSTPSHDNLVCNFMFSNSDICRQCSLT